MNGCSKRCTGLVHLRQCVNDCSLSNVPACGALLSCFRRLIPAKKGRKCELQLSYLTTLN